MGSINDFTQAFRELSESDQLELLQTLLKDFRAPIRDTKKHKHPLFELAGRWTDEEADEMLQTIKEGDWIDDGSND